MTNSSGSNLDRVLVLEMVRVTEAAAIAAARLIGRGDEKAADAAAVEAMRDAFNTLYMDGHVEFIKFGNRFPATAGNAVLNSLFE